MAKGVGIFSRLKTAFGRKSDKLPPREAGQSIEDLICSRVQAEVRRILTRKSVERREAEMRALEAEKKSMKSKIVHNTDCIKSFEAGLINFDDEIKARKSRIRSVEAEMEVLALQPKSRLREAQRRAYETAIETLEDEITAKKSGKRSDEDEITALKSGLVAFQDDVDWTTAQLAGIAMLKKQATEV